MPSHREVSAAIRPPAQHIARIGYIWWRKAASSGPGILNPIAGTTAQSGMILFGAGATGTISPCDVLTTLRTPAIETFEARRREA